MNASLQYSNTDRETGAVSEFQLQQLRIRAMFLLTMLLWVGGVLEGFGQGRTD